VLWLSQGIGLPLWTLDVCLPLLSLVSVALMWIAFFPPAWLGSGRPSEAPAP